MIKQERINVIYKSNVKMALLQGLITFPMSFFTVGLIESDSWNGWYVTGVAVCLLLLGGSFLKVGHFEAGLTEHAGAKKIIARRNGFTFVLFVLSILSIALTIKLGWMYAWIVVLTIGVLYGGYRLIRKQDERLTDIDPEHPRFREIRLDNVRD
ncbi:hypothetical protein EVJ27_11635 [Exiguobacterium sp. SH3S2]|uniref:hypothetical protein n=1 Tax=unclassified Exiguobacterium TaxID=2644629 RepID=UPI001039AEAC|nr:MULTISPECIES: hypothetical protein [unclassified Exiguobacterium]TCI42889.1 hypothetical protein EVJ28_11655 [Exiguobacterium sp. SH3S3]TCI58642.1 hypothetical protein EVJ27_11635 [Exiguobacterium sp. SH3S2]